ncbi:MAG TPA: hypothetical protein VLG76_06280 [Rhabdochlamydiaceae bacterium]|nr:hypothetical protein [Rhabdochlamydiaceae bacterium]
MKKSSLFALSLVTVALTSSQLKANEVLTELKVGYFHPESTKFRRIYGSAGIYGFETSVQSWCDLYTWISADFFIKSGHSLGLRDHTNIYFLPIGLGLKWFFPLECWDFYLGGGFLATYLHIRDDSHFVVRTSPNWGWGGIAKAGVIRNFGSWFFLDLFTSYSYTHIGFHERHHKVVYRHPANLGGWEIGLGLGFRLGCREVCCHTCCP